MEPDDPRRVLAVDLGTGGLKVGLTHLDGRIEGWEHRGLHTRYGPGGSATQDAGEWWRLVVDAARAVLAGGDPHVVAVAVTGQWASTVPVDAAGLPVGPCLMWTDTQGAPHSQRLVGGHLQGYRPRALATWIRRTGGVPSTSGADPVGHMLHLERDRPDIAGAARWYLEPVDYLSMRLTGSAAASHMSMTAAWLTDNRRLDVLEYDDRLLALAGLDGTKLPPLVPALSVLGPVTDEAAAELGIRAGAQVVTGMPDLHSAAVGSGCLGEHETHLAIGTSGWISCPVSYKKTDVIRQLASVPGLGDGAYLLGNDQDSAGRCLQWFRDHMVARPGSAPPSYEEITRLAGEAPPGSGGVLFTPWLTGERSPVDDRAARAGFHNLSVGTTQAHLARAVLEGVAFNLRWLLGATEHFTGARMDPIRIIGGGARSDLWCQIVADVCDRRLERVADPLLAGLRGAGLAAGLALGEVSRDDVRALVPVDREFRPDAANRAEYDRLFREFPRLHRVQHKMFSRLNHPPSVHQDGDRGGAPRRS